MVESQPSKLLVAGPIPVSRSIFSTTCKNAIPRLYSLSSFLVCAVGLMYRVRAVNAANI